MESRQISLLRKGYLLGRLDFKYKNPLSLARERHIINALEQEMVLKIVENQLQMDCAVASGLIAHDKKAFKIVKDSYDKYLQIALPYAHKNTNIDSNKLDKEALKEMKAFLAAGNKKLANKKKNG